jgi:hypothetical protein
MTYLVIGLFLSTVGQSASQPVSQSASQLVRGHAMAAYLVDPDPDPTPNPDPNSTHHPNPNPDP